jgi:hypothetical protein
VASPSWRVPRPGGVSVRWPPPSRAHAARGTRPSRRWAHPMTGSRVGARRWRRHRCHPLGSARLAACAPRRREAVARANRTQVHTTGTRPARPVVWGGWPRSHGGWAAVSHQGSMSRRSSSSSQGCHGGGTEAVGRPPGVPPGPPSRPGPWRPTTAGLGCASPARRCGGRPGSGVPSWSAGVSPVRPPPAVSGRARRAVVPGPWRTGCPRRLAPAHQPSPPCGLAPAPRRCAPGGRATPAPPHPPRLSQRPPGAPGRHPPAAAAPGRPGPAANALQARGGGPP